MTTKCRMPAVPQSSEPPVSAGQVQAFWDAHPCDARASASQWGSPEFFDEVTRKRYEHEWHIPLLADFPAWKGKRVLEIGCGLGVDGTQFALHGARYIGCDLTWQAVSLTRRHLAVRQLPGNTCQLNAEHMPFRDAVFDHIYSFGVIHHSPDTERIVREMYRVLKPGGTVCVMVYHKNSINYRFEIMFLRRLARYLLIPRWMPGLLARLTGFDRQKLERQRTMFLSPEARDPVRWLSMNTDGPDCPLAKVYTKASARRLFGMFTDVRCRPYFFDKTHYPLIGRCIPRPLEAALGRWAGWHLVITARKP